MLIVQADQKHYTNQYRGLVLPYKIRDLVQLDIRNLFIKQPSKKLKNCCIGKYQAKKIISNHIVKLNFLNNLHIYFIFHVNLLKPFATNDPYLSYIQPLDLSIKVNGKIKYEVTAIIDSCFFRRIKKLQYRIQ